MTTIRDIAKASGVSAATVSQVLGNGGRPVHPQTRARVVSAAQSLDYRPNAVARGLVRKRMDTIGLVFLHGDIAAHSNPFLLGVLDGVLSVSTRQNRRTMLCTLPSWETASDHVSDFSDGRCDGVLLLVPPAGCSLVTQLQRREVPFVVVNGGDSFGEIPRVDVDNVRAAFELTRVLLGLGHRRIGFVHRRTEWGFPFAAERQQGYREAMLAAGCYDPALAFLDPDEILPSVFAAQERPTALFCCLDALALSVLEALQQQGVRVPEEISVAGFDDIPGAAMSVPALTTVRQPMTQIGERAAEMLLTLIDDKQEIDRKQEIDHKKRANPLEILATEIVLRQSTAVHSPQALV